MVSFAKGLEPISHKENRERIAFEKTIASTTTYKQFRTAGRTHDESINSTMKIIGISLKAPFKDKKGNKIKWFSLTRLPPNLKQRAKKYWLWK